MDDKKLEQEILEKILPRLELEDIDVANFSYDAPIFLIDEEDTGEEGLGLDSVDALELVVLLNDEYGIKVDVKEMEKLRTIRAIADFVREKRAGTV
ncbi:MAG: phosphopantetheine-binding protein [Lachnospiraceae bacterium]